jgi:hypothetical protein
MFYLAEERFEMDFSLLNNPTEFAVVGNTNYVL